MGLEINLSHPFTRGDSRRLKKAVPELPAYGAFTIDKWECDNFFREHGVQTPKTELFTTATVARMLTEYGEVVLKPRRGSKGEQVYSVKSVDDINPSIDHADFIVQQMVDLARYHGRSLTVRAFIQKIPRHGSVPIVGSYAKITEPGKFVGNLNAGAKAEPTSAAFQMFFGDSSIPQIELDQLVKQVITALEERGMFFEAGLDIAFDRQMHPWLIEINSVPDIDPFYDLANRPPSYISHYEDYTMTYDEEMKKQYKELLRKILLNKLAAKFYGKSAEAGLPGE